VKRLKKKSATLKRMQKGSMEAEDLNLKTQKLSIDSSKEAEDIYNVSSKKMALQKAYSSDHKDKEGLTVFFFLVLFFSLLILFSIDLNKNNFLFDLK
jgi:hypothetical protein